MDADSMAAAVASDALASKCTPSSFRYAFGVGQHIHQMRDRRALIAADIRHARLQQRLGDRENSLAAKFLAFAEAQRLDFFGKRALGHRLMRSRDQRQHAQRTSRAVDDFQRRSDHYRTGRAAAGRDWSGSPVRSGSSRA